MEHFNSCLFWSLEEFIISVFEFSLKSIATPDAFEMSLECKREFPFHSLSHLVVEVVVVESVSCKKAISIFRFTNNSKVSLLLLSF